jgi:hypothetical protein
MKFNNKKKPLSEFERGLSMHLKHFIEADLLKRSKFGGAKNARLIPPHGQSDF